MRKTFPPRDGAQMKSPETCSLKAPHLAVRWDIPAHVECRGGVRTVAVVPHDHGR